ncbi:MAG: formylglycine-generating enzyme family protein [Verrucomicrobia bacterium]|nr:formylglycine-generating enzyme family protein [Verrucomicrobiota bacterium]
MEDLPIALDVGPELRLYSGAVERIGDSAGGEVGESAVAPPTAQAVVSTGAATGSNPTNREGLVWISAGEFIMGSPNDEPGRDPDEGPQTRVIIPRGFWMGRCEVTQAEYQQVTGTNPSNATEDQRRPVEKVNWYEAMDYCAKLTQRAQAADQLPRGYAYRLPTEAEWEYACRAGTTTRFSHGDDKGYVQLPEYAWFTRNSESMTHPVGTRRPNPWGLLDMHGNVWEWCLDRWDGALPGGCVTNVALPASGTLRAARGGSWLYEGAACRSANRDDYSPSNRCSDLGFRVVLAPAEP